MAAIQALGVAAPVRIAGKAQNRCASRPALAWRAAVAPVRLTSVPKLPSVSRASQRVVVRVAAAHTGDEFVMPWSPVLVPEGPWKIVEGCADDFHHLLEGRLPPLVLGRFSTIVA